MDTVEPYVSITGPQDNSETDTLSLIEGSASDTSGGVPEVELQITDGTQYLNVKDSGEKYFSTETVIPFYRIYGGEEKKSLSFMFEEHLRIDMCKRFLVKQMPITKEVAGMLGHAKKDFSAEQMLNTQVEATLLDQAKKRNFDCILFGNIKEESQTGSVGSLSALGIAYCVQITPLFSLGLTLNLWDNDLSENEWERKVSSSGSRTDDDGSSRSFGMNSLDRYSFSGFNANFGFLWNVNKKITLGGVIKTPFEADVTHERSSVTIQSGNIVNSKSSVENETMDMPMSYGIGIAYRFSDSFSVSADVYRTEWDDFLYTDDEGRETSPVTGRSPDTSDIDPTHQVRMGAEYLFVTSKYVIPVRGGIFYDPAPAEGEPDDYFGFSIGSGFGMKRFIFDMAYQYRFGNNVGASIMKSMNFSQDVEEHTVYSSVNFRY